MDTYHITASLSLQPSCSSLATSSLATNNSGSAASVVAPKKQRGKLMPPWPKGVSGNPKGSKGPRVAEAILRKTSKRALANALADKLISNANSGVTPESTRALEVILKAEGGSYNKNDTPLVAIQHNTSLSTEDIQEIIRQISNP